MSPGAHAEVSVEDRADGVRVIGLFGEIDLSNAEQIDRILRKEAEEVGEVVLDIDGLSFIDSSGLHMLGGLRRDLPDLATSLAVAAGRASIVRRTIELSGMHEVLSMHETVEEAAASFRGSDPPG